MHYGAHVKGVIRSRTYALLPSRLFPRLQSHDCTLICQIRALSLALDPAKYGHGHFYFPGVTNSDVRDAYTQNNRSTSRGHKISVRFSKRGGGISYLAPYLGAPVYTCWLVCTRWQKWDDTNADRRGGALFAAAEETL